MSWLNLNQSLNSLKGQITNFASEVLSDAVVQDLEGSSLETEPLVKELEEKCHNQALEIASLKKLNDELQTALQTEKLTKRNGVKEEESSWYWDPPPEPSKLHHNVEAQYKTQIRALQNEITNLKERDTVDLRQDTEEELSRLREENRNLTASLEDLDSQHQLAMEKLLTLKKELQKNFEVLKQEHEDLKTTNDEYSTEIKTLLAKVGDRDREIENLKTAKSDFDTLHHKYQNLERIHSLLRENAEKFQEENQELHEEVFKLQEQVTKLEHDMEIATKHSELSHMVPRESYEELLKELNDLKGRRSSDQVNLDEINIDDNAKSVIESLKREIKDLRHKLSKEHGDNEDPDYKEIKYEKIIQLYNKYVNFELPVDYVGEMPSSGDIVMCKLENIFIAVNSFKKEIDVLQHKLSEKNLNINHLQMQIEDLTTENDFLTTDIQHFERELDEMKKNNDFLISEIAALKNTSKLEPIIETHEDNLAKLETELADCTRINKTFESEIKRIEKELNEVKTEKIVLQESLRDMKEKYTSMLKKLEMCKNQTEAVQELENSTNGTVQAEKLNRALDEINDLRKRLNASNVKNEQLSIDLHIIENDKVLLTKEIDDLKHNLENKSSAHKELEALNVTLEHKLQDLGKKLAEVVRHSTEMESQKAQLENKIKTLESDMSTINISKNSDMENIKIERTQLSTKLNEIVNENSTLKETVEKLTNENMVLKKREEELLSENHSLKDSGTNDSEKTLQFQKTIEVLKAKLTDLEILNNEVLVLKEANQKLLEKKLQVETELTSTDSKIVHLEEEFDKLISNLNEKDIVIDSLNSTISQNNINLSKLNEKVNILENDVGVKNQEIESLNHTLKDISNQLTNASQNSNQSHENLIRLQSEKEEILKQFSLTKEELSSKSTELLRMKNRYEELENDFISYKSSIDSKDKEIKELNQSITELTDKIKTADNTTYHNDEYAKLAEEKEIIEKTLTDVKSNLRIKKVELTELRNKSDQLEKTCLEYQVTLDNANSEKSELINLVNLKHNESMQYHNEIQRLNHVILEQANEFKRIIDEKDKLLQNHTDSCSSCENLRITLKEKDEIIMTLSQGVNEYERVKTELSKSNETVKSLTEKCENLDRSLTMELEAVKKLTAENLQLSEKEQTSVRELERLRRHLVEMEENYTQELMTSEQKLTECQTRLHQIEERAKQTSTVYTSNSIRANQEVETLRNQIKLLEKQREEVQLKLSEAEDARSRSEAALTNLQVVLEQFQLDKERDIHAATEKIRNKMEKLKHQNGGLQDEINKLTKKLEESLAGLQAATRLGDQVETKIAQINDLKEQVRILQTSVTAAEERYYNAISNQQDKVDKNLVKNLVINYVMANTNSSGNRSQVLRILSTVLDFNRLECERVGLGKARAPDSLAAEFVKFLQAESRPRQPMADMMGITQSSSRSTTPTSRKNSTMGPQPLMEPGHKRNPSTGSNNLLFQNMDMVETSSQLSIESEKEPTTVLDTGVNQTRNTEPAILKYVLKDM